MAMAINPEASNAPVSVMTASALAALAAQSTPIITVVAVRPLFDNRFLFMALFPSHANLVFVIFSRI
jgi:hypothetical protein